MAAREVKAAEDEAEKLKKKEEERHWWLWSVKGQINTNRVVWYQNNGYFLISS
jgi:hypothetical protein